MALKIVHRPFVKTVWVKHRVLPRHVALTVNFFASVPESQSQILGVNQT